MARRSSLIGAVACEVAETPEKSKRKPVHTVKSPSTPLPRRNLFFSVIVASTLYVAVRLLLESAMAFGSLSLARGQQSPVNLLFWRNVHQKGRTVFNTLDYAWATPLRKAWLEIRAEFHAMEQIIDEMGHRMKGHVDTDAVSHWSGRPGWKQLLLLHTGEVEWVVASRMPVTTSLVLSWGAPIVSAWFSILEPNATLEIHHGEYKGILRYHLALEVPSAEASAVDMGIKKRWFLAQVSRGRRAAGRRVFDFATTGSLPLSGVNESDIRASHSSLGVCAFEDGMPHSKVSAAQVRALGW